MKPKAVFVETNWLVDVVAPAHLQSPQAVQLIQRVQNGEFELFIPAICFAEARETIPRRFISKNTSDNFRKFVRWAKRENKISSKDSEIAFRIFDQFDGLVRNELDQVPFRLQNLANQQGINCFPLSESMLEFQVEIGSMSLDLKPFDLAILAAILIKIVDLKSQGYEILGFCELDSDLLPWDRNGIPKLKLKELYDNINLQVYGSFSLPE
ncbi:MAG: hypothetical protein ACRC6M_05660 [Microcystaceae cyanobacterium]